MSKDDMTKFYQDLARIGGQAHRRITGHSPRVTGAQRMAWAGHAAWTIQLFGRWGSSAVLGYISAALLGKQGGNLAAVTEGGAPVVPSIAPLPIEDFYAATGNKRGWGKFNRKRKKQALVTAAIADMSAPFLATPGGMDAAGLDVFVSGVNARMSFLENRVHGVADADAKQYVLAQSWHGRDGQIHITSTSSRTVCGWDWATAGAVPTLDGPATCRKCVRWGR